MKIDYLTLFIIMAFFLLCCTVFFVITTKNNVRFIRDEIADINSRIFAQQKLEKQLETEFFLKSESIKIKNLSDKHLKTNFTKAYQLLQMSELSRKGAFAS